MTCRHARGDRSCTSQFPELHYNPPSEPKTPDASKYQIEQAQQVGKHLVIRALYPNCSKCSYEGRKVMVFLNVQAIEALRWKTIDPHFRAPSIPKSSFPKSQIEAPSPAARFPASDEGWSDAVAYAHGKS